MLKKRDRRKKQNKRLIENQETIVMLGKVYSEAYQQGIEDALRATANACWKLGVFGDMTIKELHENCINMLEHELTQFLPNAQQFSEEQQRLIADAVEREKKKHDQSKDSAQRADA